MSRLNVSGPPAPTFHEVRERIVARYPELTPQLKTIAQFALGNFDRMAVATVAELARELDVPGSGIVRFAQAMGYSGFLEMKKGFSAQLVYRAREIEPATAAGNPPMGWLARAAADARRSLRTLEQDFDADAFGRGVSLLSDASTVFVVGQHRSFGLAALFAWRLIEGGRNCVLLDNVGGFALPQSRLGGPKDVTLAISFSPYQPSVVEAAQAHREQGGAILAITDTQLSPLAPHADSLFLVPGGAPIGATVLVEALAGATVTHPAQGRRDAGLPPEQIKQEKTRDVQNRRKADPHP